jgi:GTP-binding protein HflX
MRAVDQILEDLNFAHIPRLRVFNKIDRIEAAECRELCRRYDATGVCARDRSTFAPLMQALQERFWPDEKAFDNLDGHTDFI